MRFLFFTDTHIRGTSPENRKDDFPETLKKKMLEIRELIEKLDIDYVVHGGDWFDRPDVSPAVVREFAIIINGFSRPIFTVAGNHDIYGQNPDSLGRTMLGLLEGIGMIRLIKQSEKIIIQKGDIVVQLTGQSYSYEIDGQDFRKYYVIKKEEDVDYAINIVHGMLLDRPFYEGVHYTLIEDIVETEAEVTLAGHYHNGFGVKKLNDRFFINPGSIARISNTSGEMKRHPSIVVVDFGKEISIHEVKLKSALPGYEVLDREKLENSKNRIMKLHEFYNNISSKTQYRGIDMEKIIEDIAENQELSREVKKEAIRRIAIAHEKLASGDEEG